MLKVVKKDVIKAVEKFSKKCPLSKEHCARCHLKPWCKNHFHPGNTDIFKECDKDAFMQSVLDTAKTFNGPFWFSSLRSKLPAEPLEPNWLGISTKLLKKNGYYITGDVRNNPLKSCRGHRDLKWAKR